MRCARWESCDLRGMTPPSARWRTIGSSGQKRTLKANLRDCSGSRLKRGKSACGGKGTRAGQRWSTYAKAPIARPAARGQYLAHQFDTRTRDVSTREPSILRVYGIERNDLLPHFSTAS